MKLHISQAQLDELSEKGKEKLVGWGEKHCDTFTTIDLPQEHGERQESIELPLLSIGQMIEFLGDTWLHDLADVWGKDHSYLFYEETTPTPGELCDALWEACKEVLEK